MIAGFLTRADCGLRAPRSFSSNITPERGGVALHWGGPAQRISSHEGCLAKWRAWQDYHMDGHRWADLAYTLGACDHGFVLAGRGARRRTAANGTNHGNQNFYAVVWLGGEGEKPTAAAINAIVWAVHELRTHGGAGMRVEPHSLFTGSACPGPDLKALASSLNNRAISLTAPPIEQTSPPAPAPAIPAYPGVTREPTRNSSITRAYQQRLKDRGWRIKVDGDHGPNTTSILRAFQQEKRLGVDGVGGRNTWRALWTAPVT